MKIPASILVGFALVAAAIYFQPNGLYQMYETTNQDVSGKAVADDVDFFLIHCNGYKKNRSLTNLGKAPEHEIFNYRIAKDGSWFLAPEYKREPPLIGELGSFWHYEINDNEYMFEPTLLRLSISYKELKNGKMRTVLDGFFPCVMVDNPFQHTLSKD